MDFLEIGKVVKPQGLKGCIKVLSYLESDALLNELTEVSFKTGKGNTPRCIVKSLKVKGRCFYLEIEGIEHIDQAEALVGCTVLVPADSLEKLPEGEYYWQELLGIAVVTEEGIPVGKLEKIFPTGSNDVYVCSNEREEIYLPAIEAVVRKIDLERGTMIVRLPADHQVTHDTV